MADEPTSERPPSTPAPAPEPTPPAEVRASAGPSPTPPSTPPAESPTPAPPATTEGTPDAAPAAPDWRELVERIDPKELLQHPRIGGIVGSRLEAERRRAAQEAEAHVQARQQDEQLERLRRDDPQAYAEEVGRRRDESARQGQVLSGIHARIATWASTLPPEVQQRVSGKTYPGSYEDGVLAYTREVADLLTEHRVAEAVARERKRWETDVRAAIRKEVLAELNGGEPAPDTARGASPGGNGFKVPTTLEELRRLPSSVYKAHAKEIDAAVLSGRMK
jgi:hypothetical protein